jgi:hypothetical protein
MKDLRFSRQWLWRKPSSWVLRLVAFIRTVPPKRRFLQEPHGWTSLKATFLMSEPLLSAQEMRVPRSSGPHLTAYEWYCGAVVGRVPVVRGIALYRLGPELGPVGQALGLALTVKVFRYASEVLGRFCPYLSQPTERYLRTTPWGEASFCKGFAFPNHSPPPKVCEVYILNRFYEMQTEEWGRFSSRHETLLCCGGFNFITTFWLSWVKAVSGIFRTITLRRPWADDVRVLQLDEYSGHQIAPLVASIIRFRCATPQMPSYVIPQVRDFLCFGLSTQCTSAVGTMFSIDKEWSLLGRSL